MYSDVRFLSHLMQYSFMLCMVQEREKTVVRKKERKKVTVTKATNGISEGESAPEPSPETTSVTPLESEAREKPFLLRGLLFSTCSFPVTLMPYVLLGGLSTGSTCILLVVHARKVCFRKLIMPNSFKNMYVLERCCNFEHS